MTLSAQQRRAVLREGGIYLIADAGTLAGQPLIQAVAAAVAAGVRLVQYRDKSPLTGPLLEQARAVCLAVRERGALFIVNDRADVALLTDADGLHVGQDDIPLADARALMGLERVIGVSTHDLAEAEAAQEGGADYVGFGNVFGTTTKTDVTPAQGVDALTEVCARLALPVFAIGGVGAVHLAPVRKAGAAGGALVSSILKAADPGAEAARLCAEWDSAST
ncbi:MAG: thiamine phosphate synthase [Nitrospirota bacterium]|nr:thiamine phosphate synthase [Nitrospirota bacterium]